MNIIRPLQISFNHQVLEQNSRFYFTVSASLGINLQTGKALLDLYYLKDVFEAMGKTPLPDMGMPKPNGEFLVSGSFFAQDGNPVRGGEAKVTLGDREKSLYIFGPRKWRAGLPSEPERFTEMPIDYTKAFGGEGFNKNPEGIGFNDGLLPCIETPGRLVGSKRDTPDPAGFGPLYPMLPQRMQYQGTYDADYKKKYFPGYPLDHDWRFFLCAPGDQWIKGFFSGEESYALYHMHPDFPVIQGSLPGLYARCFIIGKEGGQQRFGELPLNLDTVWFFPERLIGLLIFRGVTEVADDEAEEITDVITAYEKNTHSPRSMDYYKTAFEKRKTGRDNLLATLKTEDLIPDSHESAMETLMGGAVGGEGDSEMSINIAAKAEAIVQMTDEKIEEAIQHFEKNMDGADIPHESRENLSGEAKAHMQGEQGKIDIRSLAAEKSKAVSDQDLEKLNKRLESLLPGITAAAPGKIDMKNFSFEILDEIFEAIDAFSTKKEKQAMDFAGKEMEKAKQQITKELKSIDLQIENAKAASDSIDTDHVAALEETKQKIKKNLETVESLNPEGTSKKKAPLPRVNKEKLKARTVEINPRIMEAVEHLQAMKAVGIQGEETEEMEKQIQKAIDVTSEQLEKGLKEAQDNFMEGYIMTAHFMDEGISPHEDTLDAVKQGFLDALSRGENLSEGDFACIDLSGINLDGMDLSKSFFEQVSFKGASLQDVNFSNAILARADLRNADLTGACFEGTNLGAVHAGDAIFTRANLKSAKLSKGDFTRADFTQADLQDIEALEIIISGADFTRANMPELRLIEIDIRDATFKGANINSSGFIKCSLQNCNFTGSIMDKCTIVDTDLDECRFEKAVLSNACFMATAPEKSATQNLTFRKACLNQSNFQNMRMQRNDFSYVNMENGLFQGTNLSGCGFSHARARGAQFRKANLTGAILDHINLDQGSLAKANLTDASFKNANLHAVDFLRSNIIRTDFSEANLDTTLIEHWRP